MDANRKQWNENQKYLRKILDKPAHYDEAIALFLSHHAMVHSAEMTQMGVHSFADEIWQDATELLIRRIPKNCGVSIAWHLWHLARIEDMTMNVLIADRPQLYDKEGWAEKIHAPAYDTGNAMDVDEARALSEAVNIDALRAYRIAVGRATREIVQQIPPEAMKHKVDPARLQRLKDSGAVVPEAYSIIDYWSKRTFAGLLLMPPTRHNLVHINQALKLKARRH